MLALKRLPEKHTLIKLAAQTNKRTQILIQIGRGKRQGGTNNDMCSASASVQLCARHFKSWSFFFCPDQDIKRLAIFCSVHFSWYVWSGVCVCV